MTPQDQPWFEFPQVRPCDIVEVAEDPNWLNPSPAIVLRVAPDAIDVLVVSASGHGEMGVRRSCWHRKDPRCFKAPYSDRFQGDEFQNHDTGVFDLSQKEKEFRQLGHEVHTLREQVTRMSQQVEEMQNMVRAATSEKKRGRPPKHPPLPLVAVEPMNI